MGFYCDTVNEAGLIFCTGYDYMKFYAKVSLTIKIFSNLTYKKYFKLLCQ